MEDQACACCCETTLGDALPTRVVVEDYAVTTYSRHTIRTQTDEAGVIQCLARMSGLLSAVLPEYLEWDVIDLC